MGEGGGFRVGLSRSSRLQPYHSLTPPRVGHVGGGGGETDGEGGGADDCVSVLL